MIGEGLRLGANAFRAIIQRRKEKRAQKKAAKAAEKASALERKLYERISPGESSASGESLPTKMVFPVFGASEVFGEEKPRMMGFFQKYWPVALAAVGLVFILNFFKRKRR